MFRSSSFLFLPLIIALSGCAATGDVNRKTDAMIGMLKKYHYRDIPLGEDRVKEIKTGFLKGLDPDKYYFTENDLKALMETGLDLSLPGKGDSAPFVKKTCDLYKARLNDALSIIEKIMKKGFNYGIDEEISFTGKGYCRDRNELEDRWRKFLKYRMLDRFYHEYRDNNLTVGYEKRFHEMEESIRGSVYEQEKNIIINILRHPDGFENAVTSQYLNAVASVYDTHSSYLSSVEMDRLRQDLSATRMSFGINLKRSITGELRINSLVPGGPAWRSGRLNRDDIVVAITKIPGKDEPVQVRDRSLSDIYKIFGDASVMKIMLTVEKQGGSLVQVPLAKEKLVNEDNIVTSYVLKGEKKVGYIYLPSFYTEWDTPGAPACASDVAREILKLKRDGIEGIILDLRGNSGGSLYEAIQLAGLFIDEGPICIASSRKDKPFVIKDPVRGTVYTGPLVVMVNRYSASASEFFAAAMKDYNRAVIIGSPTYGKATSQMILPLAHGDDKDGVPGYVPGLDYMRITTNLYYDLHLSSHHNRGVAPHITLPDIHGAVPDRDRKDVLSVSPLKYDRELAIDRKGSLPLGFLVQRSRSRTGAGTRLKELAVLSERMRRYVYDRDNIPLTPEAFRKHMNMRMEIIRSADTRVYKKSLLYAVDNNSSDAPLCSMDPYRKGMSDEVRIDIGRDVYIEEAYSVMKDYIPLFRGR